MEIVKNDPLKSGISLGQLRPDLPESGIGEIFGAAFTLESDVFAAYQHLTRPTFPVDNNFNLFDALKDDPLAQDYADNLARAQSNDELNFIRGQINSELRAKQVMASGGWTGLVAGLTAGTLSPTLFIPLVGGAKGALGIAQTFGLAAAAAGAQEAALLGLHETRTWEEAAFGVAAGTVIGGLLGSAAKYMTPAAMERAALDMVPSTDERAILKTREDGGMEMVRIAPEAPAIPAEYKLLTAPSGDRVGYIKEPVVPEGFVRMYHGGALKSADATLPNNFTSEVNLASHYAGDKTLSYVDIPKEHPLLEKLAINNFKGSLTRTLDPAEFGGAKTINILAEDALPKKLEIMEGAGGPTQGLSAQAAETEVGRLRRADTRLGKAIDTQLAKLEEVEPTTAAGRAAKSVGLGVAKTVSDPLALLARLNPVTRLQDQQVSKAARAIMSQIFSPLEIKGGGAATSGTAFDRAAAHQRFTSEFLLEYDNAFLHYISDGKASGKFGEKFLAKVKTQFNLTPAGKMNYAEFGDTVFTLGNLGGKHPEPMVMKAVAAQKRYYDSVNEIAKRYDAERVAIDGDAARKIYDEIEFGENSEIQAYTHHIFNPKYLNDHLQEFLEVFGANALKNMIGGFKAGLEKTSKAVKKLDELEAALKLDEPAINARVGAITLEREGIDAVYGAMLQKAKDFRKALRAADVPKADIEAQMNGLETGFGQDYIDSMVRRKEIDKELSLLRKIGAGVSEKQSKLLDQVEQIEVMQLDALDRVARMGVQTQKKLDKLIENAMREDDEFNGLWERFAKAHAQSLRNDKRLVKLIDNISAHDDLVDKQDALRVRMEGLQQRIKDFEYDDLEGAKELIDEAQLLYNQRINELNSKRAVRADNLIERAKKLDPEERAKYREAELVRVAETRAEVINKFEQRWHDEGGTEVSFRDGTASFVEQAKRDAADLYARITGNPLRVSGMEVLGAERGPQLRRTMQIPFAEKKKFLVTDPEQVVRAHGHSMFPDLELYRISGSVNGAPFFERVRLEKQQALLNLAGKTHRLKGKLVNSGELTPEELGKAAPLTAREKEKLSADLNKQYKDIETDLGVVITRMRHTRGQSPAPDALGYRLGRVALNLNVTRLMGGVVMSSFADLARPVFMKGFNGVFKDVWKPFATDMKSVKATRAEGRRHGYALDAQLHNRSAAWWDTGENMSIHQTMIERGLETLANKTGFVALFDRWTDEMKHLAGRTAFGEMSHWLRMANEGNPNSVEFIRAKEALEWVGISPNTARRIWDQYKLPNGSDEFEDGFRLPNTESWNDFDAMMAMKAATQKLVNHQIITPGLDRPNWVDANMAFKLVAQFRSYTFTATTRILMSGLQRPDMVFMQGAMSSIALGMLSYYTWAMASGGRAWEEAQDADMSQLIYEGIGRSGMLGIFGEVQKMGEQVPGLNDYEIFGGGDPTSRQIGSLREALAGPTAGLTKDLENFIMGLDDPTQSTLHSARKMVPYQNVFYFRRILDQMEQSLADVFGLPERRN